MAAEKMSNVTGKGEEWVGRYVNMVYGAALRQMGGDTHGAADVTQAVFIVAAEKAKRGKLPEEGRMAGWLLKVTGYCVMKGRRAAMRRSIHERRVMEGRSEAMEPEATAGEVIKSLDQALLKLGGLDREVVVQRYLRGEEMAAVAAALSVRALGPRLLVVVAIPSGFAFRASKESVLSALTGDDRLSGPDRDHGIVKHTNLLPQPGLPLRGNALDHGPCGSGQVRGLAFAPGARGTRPGVLVPPLCLRPPAGVCRA